MNKMNKDNKQKFMLIGLIVSIIAGWFGMRVGILCGGSNWINSIGKAFSEVGNDILHDPFKVSWGNQGFSFAAAFFGIVMIVCLMLLDSQRKPEEVGSEYGSSRWATLKEITAFKNNSEKDTNIVFSENAGLAVKLDKNLPLEDRLIHERNWNVAVIGGSGSGKTRFYVKPNLMQCHGNYFVTDPKGTCIEEVGHLLEAEGYDIKMFNVIPAVKEKDENGKGIPFNKRKSEMSKSMAYNPLAYVKTKDQIPAFVNCLIKNTNGEKKDSSDPFWEKSETLLYIALLSFMLDWLPREQFHLPKLVEILSLAQASENDENLESPLDLLFQEIEKGCCYVSCDRNDTKTTKASFNNELAEGWCVLTNQVKKQTQFVEIDDGQFEEITYFTNQNNQSSANMNSASKWGFAASPTYELYGCGKLSHKKGYIDVPSALVNNKTGKSAWTVWCEHAENGDFNYKVKLEDYVESVNDAKFCLEKYQEFKKAAGETLKSIIISCNVRLTPIALPEINRILKGKLDENGNPTGECEMELDALGDKDRKICTFAIMSDTNDAFFFLVAMMMYQAMDSLCNKALTDYGGKLPTFVHFILDEFANLGVLPDFNRTIAIARSRNIGVSMILQSLFQLEVNYKKEEAKTIMGNCDSVLYLGGGDEGAKESTCKEISERLGKKTIMTRTYNKSFGPNKSTSESNQIIARDLMTPDEVAKIPKNECLIMIKNTYPYRDIKTVLENNNRYAWIDPLAHNPNYSCLVNTNFNFEIYKKNAKNKNTIKKEKNNVNKKSYDLYKNIHNKDNTIFSDYVSIAQQFLATNNINALEKLWELGENEKWTGYSSFVA